MKENASRSAAPDTAYGWGLVDLSRITWQHFANPVQLAVDEIRVFPNPFNSRLVFLLDIDDETLSSVRIEMYDLLGRIVYSKACSGIREEGELLITAQPSSELAAGIYFAVFTMIETGQIIGQKKCIKLEY